MDRRTRSRFGPRRVIVIARQLLPESRGRRLRGRCGVARVVGDVCDPLIAAVFELISLLGDVNRRVLWTLLLRVGLLLVLLLLLRILLNLRMLKVKRASDKIAI